MSHRFRSLATIGLVIAVVTLNACASVPESASELMPPVKTFSEGPKLGYALGNVSLGYEPNNASYGELYKQALRNTLEATGIFDQEASDSLVFKIAVSTINLGGVSISGLINFGLDRTVSVMNVYNVYSSTGSTIVSHRVLSEGSATIEEHFVGAERVEKATRRAIVNNISIFRDWFVNFASHNRDQIDQEFKPPVALPSLN